MMVDISSFNVYLVVSSMWCGNTHEVETRIAKTRESALAAQAAMTASIDAAGFVRTPGSPRKYVFRPGDGGEPIYRSVEIVRKKIRFDSRPNGGLRK